MMVATMVDEPNLQLEVLKLEYAAYYMLGVALFLGTLR